MEDDGIVALYFARNEQALEETAKKYGADCHAVSYQILRSHEDAEECVNDTYIRGDRTLLGSYSYAATVGDDLVIAQENGSDRMTLFNASGDIVAEDIALQTELFSHVWQGHGYLSALDSHGRVGLMDSTGSWAIAPEMNYIYGISNGYALCVLEDGSYRAISLEDGTTFDCAYGICDVYDQGLILELDERRFITAPYSLPKTPMSNLSPGTVRCLRKVTGSKYWTMRATEMQSWCWSQTAIRPGSTAPMEVSCGSSTTPWAPSPPSPPRPFCA